MGDYYDEDDCKVFVGNLSWDARDENLKDLFESRGLECKDCVVIFDKNTQRSRGFGFVRFGEPESVDQAINDFNGVDLMGRELNVRKAEKKSRGPPRGGGGYNSGGGGGYHSGGGGGGYRGDGGYRGEGRDRRGGGGGYNRDYNDGGHNQRGYGSQQRYGNQRGGDREYRD